MNLNQEIKLLQRIYNTLGLISTKGQDTLYMSQSLNAIIELVNMLEIKHEIVETIEIPISDIKEE